MKALAVINPHAGGGKGLTVGTRVRSHFSKTSHEITFVEASSLEESLNLVDSFLH